MATTSPANNLSQAIHLGDNARVRELLSEGHDPNTAKQVRPQDRNKHILPLSLAVLKHDIEAIDLLMKAGAKPTGMEARIVPLTEAIRQQRLDLVKMLLVNGDNPYNKLPDHFSHNHFEEACIVGVPDILEYLLDEFGTPPAREDGFNLFHAALINTSNQRHKHILRILFDRGFDPLAVANTPTGAMHPVYLAAERSDAEVLDRFLAAGADPNLRNTWQQGKYATRELSLVASVILRKTEGRQEMLETLVKHGANLRELVDFNPSSVSLNAKMDGSICSDDAFMRFPGMNLLALAVAADELECSQYLLDQGLDPNFQNPQGNTVLHAWITRAVSRGLRGEDLVYLETLLEGGANINAVNADGDTVLHVLARQAPGVYDYYPVEKQAIFEEFLIRLLERGSDPSLLNQKNKTPLDLAKHTKKQNRAEVLIDVYSQRKTMDEVAPQAPQQQRRARL